MPEIEILTKVLGKRSGHIRGVGRKLKGVSSSSSSKSSSSSYYSASKMYTQEEENKLIDENGKSVKKKVLKKVFVKKLQPLLTRNLKTC